MIYKLLCQTSSGAFVAVRRLFSGAFVAVRRLAFGSARLLLSIMACNDNICYHGVYVYFVWPVIHGPLLMCYIWF
jgi:hypothetical protein